ncbi:MAG: CHRD domain-containing protein [Hyphomicrobiaceae bacterium]
MATAFQINMTGAQQVPGVASTAVSYGFALFNPASTELEYGFLTVGLDFGSYFGIGAQTVATTDDVIDAHFHSGLAGENGGVVFNWKSQDSDDFDGGLVSGIAGTAFTGGRWELTDPASTSLSTFAATLGAATIGQDVGLYANIHTIANPVGEIRGQLIGAATDAGEAINGTTGPDLLIGLNGADTINGLGGLDIVWYGSDQTVGGTAGVYVDLQSGFAQDGFGNYDILTGIVGAVGSDRMRVPGLSDVMIGDANGNFFAGNDGLDYIVGNGGNDTIMTGGGDAGVVGDIAVAGAGNDYVEGEGGATFAYGGAGSDFLTDIGGGNDWLFGGDFSGTVTGTDTMLGGAGNDVLAVGSAGGNASMSGGTGNDTIYGGSGAAGNDTIIGGAGSDYMYGGSGGNDVYRFETADIVNGDFDTLLGFNAGDTLSFAASLNGVIFGQQTTINGTSGAYLSTASGWALWMPFATWAGGVQSQVTYTG